MKNVNMKNDTTPTPNGFLATMQRHRGGHALTEASEALARVVAGVLATGKPGKLTITLAVKPAGRSANALMLSDQIGETVPALGKPDSFWFGDDSGNLLTEDPRQTVMQFTPRALSGGEDETTEQQQQPRAEAAH